MPFVDLSFRIHGKLLPADHGYHLFSAISKIIPDLHGDEEIGLHPISGKIADNRCLALTPRSSLTFRIEASRIKQILPLAGKKLRLGEHEVQVGVPNTRALKPYDRLYSRLVVIKGFMEPETFLEAARRQLDALIVKGTPTLVDQAEIMKHSEGQRSGSHSPFLRRTIRIRDKEIVGFALRVGGLTPDESIRLQEKGLGGRRRFGCGIFIPDRKKTP